jgi:hypothetical protein
MRIERFEDIIAWKKAKELTISVYNLYRDNRDFEFKGSQKNKLLFS